MLTDCGFQWSKTEKGKGGLYIGGKKVNMETLDFNISSDIISAIDKSIPKIPITFAGDYIGCPNCYNVNIFLDYDYCPNCGQRLNWGNKK